MEQHMAPGLPLVVISPFREVVFSVRTISTAEGVYKRIAGWQVVHRGDAPPKQAYIWGVSASNTIKEVVLRDPSSATGLVRLVQFDGAAGQQVIRSSGRTWDVGGILDVNVSVRNIQATFEQLRDSGWHAVTDPHQFVFANTLIKGVLIKGHDDIVFGLIERIHPPLPNAAALGEVGNVFSSTQTVKNLDRELAFYTEKLGFEVAYRGKLELDPTVANYLGLPYNLVVPAPEIAVVSPTGELSGAVELLAMPHLTGTDFSARAAPPNRGILMLRYPVTNAGLYHDRLKASGVSIVTAPTDMRLAPYGNVKLFAIRTPNGVWIEFFEEL
jgi:catechol 2,3-dioxygenase-like lactoylglutathione lyase family enzyme